MKKVGLLLISSAMVTMRAQQASVIVNFITINAFQNRILQIDTKAPLSTKQYGKADKEIQSQQVLAMSSCIVQKENAQEVVSPNWQEITEIVPDQFITYDDKRTKQYKWNSQSKPGNYVDFVQTYWPPSQWYGSSVKPSCLIYINDLKNKEVYEEFEQDICCHLVKNQNEDIEFLCTADKSLEKVGFVRQGTFLSKKIPQTVMAALASRR